MNLTAGLLLCCATLASSPLSGQGEVAFELGLQALASSVRAGQLELASDQLQNLWTIHARKPYVRRRRAELIEYAKRIRFAQEHKAPSLQAFLPGKVISWSRSSGDAKLRLEAADLKAYRKGRDLYRLPVTMQGAHEIGITGGPALEKHGFWMQVCVWEGSAFELEFGALIPSRGAEDKQTHLEYTDRLFRVQGGNKSLADDTVGRVKQSGRGQQVRIRIGQRQVEVWRGTHKTVKSPLRRKPRGRLWIQADDLQSIVIQGRIDKHWLQARREDWLDARWRIYLRDWKDEEQLPAWLLPSEAPERVRQLELPDRLDEEQKEAFAPLLRIWQTRRWSALSRKIFYLDKRRVSADTILWMQALADLGLDRKREATRQLVLLLGKRPGFDPARSKLADIYRRAHQPDSARDLWRQAMKSRPKSSRPRAELARHDLLMGQRERARRVLADAATSGIESQLLRSLEDTCVLMELGPAWKTRSEHRSSHYLVSSDLDLAECKKAAGILESARSDFLRRFPRLDTGRKAPYAVYLFSSQKGFATYVSRIFSRPDIHTAGLFSPILGQLLVWKPLEANELERTLRHEAIHQLMEGKLGTAPPWLQEGLALSFEQVGRVGSKIQPELQRRALLSLLAPKLEDLPTLSTLFALSGESFAYEAPRNYAWSASFALFLLHEESASKGLLDGILEKHMEHKDPDKARAAFVDTVDLVELESHYRAFLEGLLSKSR